MSVNTLFLFYEPLAPRPSVSTFTFQVFWIFNSVSQFIIPKIFLPLLNIVSFFSVDFQNKKKKCIILLIY